MKKDQLILLTAVIAAAAMTSDDNKKDLDPQKALEEFFKYMDSNVAAFKIRFEYYQKNYDLNLSQPHAESGGLMDNLSSVLTPELITTLVGLVGKIK